MWGKLHGFGKQAAVFLGNGHGQFGCLGNAVVGKRVGGGKTPTAVGNNAYAHAITLGVYNILHLILSGNHKLVKVAAYAHVGIGGTLAFGGIQRHIRQFLFKRGITGRPGGIQRHGTRKSIGFGQQGGPNAQARHVQKISPFQSFCLFTWLIMY